jgi:hypothetical protein
VTPSEKSSQENDRPRSAAADRFSIYEAPDAFYRHGNERVKRFAG